MKFKDLEEGKLYQNKDFTNVYTKLNGLLYHMGAIYNSHGISERFELDMYYVEYTPVFILDMEFYEIRLGKIWESINQ